MGFQQINKGVGQINQSIWQSNLAGTGGNTEFLTKVSDFTLMAAYVNNDVVYTCAEMNATAVASTPYHLYSFANSAPSKSIKKLTAKQHKSLQRKGDDVVEMTSHPLLTLLNESGPDDDIKGFQFIKAIQLMLEVFGRAYVYKELNQVTDTPEALRILKSYYVLPIRDLEGKVTFYAYTNFLQDKHGTKKETVELPKQDVIDFRNISISDIYAGGSSWVRAAYAKASLGDKLVETEEWILNNRARPDALIVPKTENLDPDQAKRLQAEFETRVGRYNNGKPLVISQAVGYYPLNFPPDSLAPLKFNEEMVRAVCSAAGIPQALVLGDATYNGHEAALEQWSRNAILPRIMLLQQVLNDSLVSLYDDVWLEFESPVPEDLEFQLELDKVLIQKATIAAQSGVATQNEIRVLLGLPEKEGMDEVAPNVDMALNRPATAPTTAPDEPKAPQAPEVPSVPENATEEQAEATKGTLGQLLKLNKAVASGTLDRATAINLAAYLGVDQYEAKQLIGHRCSCGCKGKSRKSNKASPVNRLSLPAPIVKPNPKLEAILRDAWDKQRLHYMAQIGTEAETKAASDNLPKQFIPVEQWDEDLADEVKPLIRLEVQRTADKRLKLYGDVGADPNVLSVPPAHINEAADKATLKFCQSTNASTALRLNVALDELRQQIKDGIAEGDGIPLLRNRVNEIFDGLNKNHAELIARTETSRAVHTGMRMAAKESGVVKGFKFLVSDDACDKCLDLKDSEVGLDGSFQDDDYDDSLLPVHCSCRCTCTEIIDNSSATDDE